MPPKKQSVAIVKTRRGRKYPKNRKVNEEMIRMGRSHPETERDPKTGLTEHERWRANKYEYAQSSVEYSQHQHQNQCHLCLLDRDEPGVIEAVRTLFMQWYSTYDIEEVFGYRQEEKVEQVIDEKTGEMEEIHRTVRIPVLPAITVQRHARMFNWSQERSENTEGILGIVIDAGINTVIRSGAVSEQILMAALDMRNKLEGSYFKPAINTKDLKAQMLSTVMSILAAHHTKGQTDVTKEMIIESLAKRPGFQHIKIILKDR